MNELEELYNEIIMEHGMHSCHKKHLPCCDRDGLGKNPNCGDELSFEVQLDGDNIKDMAFEGHGCAISQASASVMIEVLQGKSKEEAKKIINTFISMIKDGNLSEEQMDSLEDAAAFKNVAHMPARVKCALLAWHTMDKMLSEEP